MVSFRTLLSHQWLEIRRSTFWQKNLIINILLFILLVYLAINILVLGWLLDEILTELFPDQDIILKFTELLFYYFLLDLLGRFVFQDLPVLSINPYLHLPVKRVKLFDYLLFRSLFSFFNLIPLLLVVPFFVKVVQIQRHTGAFVWLAGIVILILINNYVTFFLKKIFGFKPLVSLSVLALVVILAYLDSIGMILVSKFFGRIYSEMVATPIFLLVPLSALALAFYIDRNLLASFLYKESGLKTRHNRLMFSRSFSFLGSLGIAGSLIMLEIRLVFRNARPRTLAIMSSLFLLYGFIMYPNGLEMGYNFLLFIGFFLTGLFMYSHGQLILAWDSSHFDFLFVQNLSPYEILASKYRLFLGANTLFYIVTLPYGLYGSNIIFINTCMYLFNSGVTAYFIMLVGVHNTKRVDLTKGAFLNYEGFSGMTYLIILPAIGLPYLLFLPFTIIGYPILGIGFLGFLGILGIILNKTLIIKLGEIMVRRKYKMASGFRKT